MIKAGSTIIFKATFSGKTWDQVSDIANKLVYKYAFKADNIQVFGQSIIAKDMVEIDLDMTQDQLKTYWEDLLRNTAANIGQSADPMTTNVQFGKLSAPESTMLALSAAGLVAGFIV